MKDDRPGTVEFSCPFCGGYVHASAEDEHIVHKMPPCQKYMDLEPDDFPHACSVEFDRIQSDKGLLAARLAFKPPPPEGRS